MTFTAFTGRQEQLLRRLLDEKGIGRSSGPVAHRAEQPELGPLSFAQERLYFFDQVDVGSPLYVVAGMLRMRGELDVRALRDAISCLVERHAALRTGFEAGPDGVPAQRVHAAGSVPVELRVHRVPPEELDSRAMEFCRRPIPLAGPSLLRSILFRTGDDDWAFVLCVHHIVVDGWSMEVLAGELGAAYTALHEGERPRLPPVPATYRDYTDWQRERFESGAFDEQLGYWRTQLAAVTPLELVPDRSGPAGSPFAGDWVPIDLSRELVARLAELAAQEQATLYMVLLAGWAVVLQRWSGREDVADIVVGGAIAGRSRPELESVVGFFVNTLSFRVDLRGQPRFRDLVRRAREVCLAAYRNQDVPFEQVVRAVHPHRRDDGRSPIVRHMLVLHNMPRGRLRLPGLDAEVSPVHTGSAKFDLEIELTPTTDGGLTGFLEFATDLFGQRSARQMISALTEVLGAAAAEPELVSGALPLLTEPTRDAVVRRWSGADQIGRSAATSVVERFEAVVDRDPDAVAVVAAGSGESLTYAELDRRANRLAHWLRARGVSSEVRVAVCLARGVAQLPVILGVLKAGGVYVPLDPGYPPARLSAMVEDCDPLLVLADSTTDRQLAPESGVVSLDDVAADSSRLPSDRSRLDVPPSSAAYVLFTSGSTGRPKGAVNTHEGLWNRLRWAEQNFGVTASDVVLHKTPVSFDVSLWELLLPLVTGARLVLARPDGHRDPVHLLSLLDQEHISVVHFVPSMLRALLAAGTGSLPGGPRLIVCSGEELPSELAQRCRRAFPRTDLWNLYGPTEAAIDVAAFEVRSTVVSRVPIGVPIDGVELLVLDARLNPVPPGVPGELYIGGVQLARGYVHGPGLTAARFVPHPFRRGERLYATGDRARWLWSGVLEFLGRLDHQVKIRGQRVELGEIEALLRAHPGVADAVVTVAGATGDTSRLVAHVIPGEHQVWASESATERVARWREVFDELHSAERAGGEPAAPEGPAVDPMFDTAGWISSYTGEPIPADEMRDWVEGIVGRALELPHATVLELGCGSGLLLFRIAPHCRSYLGTDVSGTALRVLERRLSCLGAAADRVALRHQPADDPTGIAVGAADQVLVNSVTQYFPDAAYLISVLDTAVAACRDGGAVVVGDIRNMRLLTTLHTSVRMSRASDELPVADLWELVRQEVAEEEELVVDPDLFRRYGARHPRVSAVRIMPKPGRYANELTKFRFDAVLRVGGEDATFDEPIDRSSPTALELATDLRTAALLEAAATAGEEGTVGTLRASASVPARDVDISDAYGPRTTGSGEPSWPRFTNDPCRATLSPVLRDYLREHLPDYAVPDHVLIADSWPVGPSGKIDRLALPKPSRRRHGPALTFVAARTPTEQMIAGIWSELLDLRQVGVHDDFFDIGGHSLLATQAVFRVNEACRVNVRLGEFFQAGTVAELAALVDSKPVAAPMSAIPLRERRPRKPH